tara:strand:+ start:239 stop:739 length:501 start_codon:yes stop_codon:yes gene_type:complete
MNYSEAERKIIKRHYQASFESMGWQLLIGKNCMLIMYKADDMWERWQTEDGFVQPPHYPTSKKFKVQNRFYEYQLDGVDELIKIIAIFRHVMDKVDFSGMDYGKRYDVYNFIIDNYLIPFEKAKRKLAEDYIEEDVKDLFNDYKQDKFIEHHNKIHDEMREAQKVQ